MKSEHVAFINDQGLQLDALLDRPDSGNVRAWAIFAHCFTCNKDFKAAAYISHALTDDGLGVLRFDFTGLGSSQGIFEDTGFQSNVTDILSAARYLDENHQGPRLLIGHSLGGTAALFASARIDSVAALVTIGSPAEPGHLMRHLAGARVRIEREGRARILVEGRPFTVKRQFLLDLEQMSLADRMRRINKALLILHAPRDGTVGIDNAAAIFKAARHPKSFVALDGADHLLSDKQDAAYAGRLISAWAGRYMQL